MKFVLLPLLVGLAIGAGCGCDEDDEEEGSSPAAEVSTSAPTSDMVELRDPVEDAFTVSLPKGWNNRAYSARAYDIHRAVCMSVSPDGETLLFRGDPSIPNYFTPEGANPVTYDMAKVNPLIKVEPFRPVSEFLPDYAQRKFGKLEGFTIGDFEDDPETGRKMEKAFADQGMQIQASCGKLAFTFTEKGKTRNVLLLMSIANGGSLFNVGISGISTSGNPRDYEPMIAAIQSSEKMNPAWVQKQNELHAQRMEQIRQATAAMTARHNQNMAWIQNSAARHQERMRGLWAQSDASMNAYWERSAASDLSHQGFINYINDEHTVVSSSGKTFQVDNSYDTYFMNKNDGTYVGGHSTWDTEKLRSMGLNPDNYEQVQIRN